ncbi:MAG: hypothetical protein E7415_06690 [Ruminococcaceae bacterium]|nr:hypothetical protein [Oscillospiraceae bacterium]
MTLEQIIHNFGISMLPIAEIRGSIIYCFTQNFDTLNLFIMYLIAVIGNFLPVPFIILLFRPLLKFFKKFHIFRGICEWLENRTHKKAGKMTANNSNTSSLKSLIALYVFVAIPFPTTGAWTGSMIAGLFDIRLRRALPAILLGIMTSGLLMILLCKIGAESLGFLGFLVK